MKEYEELKVVAEAMHEQDDKAQIRIDCGYLFSMIERLESMEKDVARLDWLEASNESHGFCHTEYGEYRYYAHQVSGCRTVRQAIDAAMRS